MKKFHFWITYLILNSTRTPYIESQTMNNLSYIKIQQMTTKCDLLKKKKEKKKRHSKWKTDCELFIWSTSTKVIAKADTNSRYTTDFSPRKIVKKSRNEIFLSRGSSYIWTRLRDQDGGNCRQRGNLDYRVRLYYLRRGDFTTLNFRQPTVNNDNSRPFLLAGRSSTERQSNCWVFAVVFREGYSVTSQRRTRRSRSC